MPIGAIIGYGAATAPPGWLLCDGSAVSRTTYAALFAVIGTGFGAGDGVTTFNVPDYRGRSPLGNSPGGLGPDRPSVRNLGDVGGEQFHTLTVAELASHDHGLTQVFNDDTSAAGGIPYTPAAPFRNLLAGASSDISIGVNTDTNGSDTGHNTMHPFQVCGWIIMH
jgi:microcystin-dependent protein